MNCNYYLTVLIKINISFAGSDTYNCEFLIEIPSTMDTSTLSEKFYMKYVPWRIHTEISSKCPEYLGIYLICDKQIDFGLRVNFSIKLDSIVDKQHEVSYKDVYVFTSKSDAWGWSEFVTLSDLQVREKGLMRNGMIAVKLSATFI